MNTSDTGIQLNTGEARLIKKSKKPKRVDEDVGSVKDEKLLDSDSGDLENSNKPPSSSKLGVVMGWVSLLSLPPLVIALFVYVWFFGICPHMASMDLSVTDNGTVKEKVVRFARGQVEFVARVMGQESDTGGKSGNSKSSKLGSKKFDAKSVYAGGSVPFDVESNSHFSSVYERGSDDNPIVAETHSDRDICRLVKSDTGKYKLRVNTENSDFPVSVLAYYTLTINGIDAECAPDDKPMLFVKDTGSAFNISRGTDNSGEYIMLDNTEGSNLSNDEAVRILKTYESMIENIDWDIDY